MGFSIIFCGKSLEFIVSLVYLRSYLGLSAHLHILYLLHINVCKSTLFRENGEWQVLNLFIFCFLSQCKFVRAEELCVPSSVLWMVLRFDFFPEILCNVCLPSRDGLEKLFGATSPRIRLIQIIWADMCVAPIICIFS